MAKLRTIKKAKSPRLPEQVVATTHPTIACEVIPRQRYRTEELSPGSPIKLKFTCQICSHSYFKSIASRTRAVDEGREHRGCPKCSRRKPTIRFRPEPLDAYLKMQCVEEKGLTPVSQLWSDNKELRLWKCVDEVKLSPDPERCGFEWRAFVSQRIKNPACPKCDHGLKRVDVRNLEIGAKGAPSKVVLYKRSKNRGALAIKGELPEALRFFWQCTKDPRHLRYDTYRQVSRKGCPTCYGQSIKGTNLATVSSDPFIQKLQKEFKAVYMRPARCAIWLEQCSSHLEVLG